MATKSIRKRPASKRVQQPDTKPSDVAADLDVDECKLLKQAFLEADARLGPLWAARIDVAGPDHGSFEIPSSIGNWPPAPWKRMFVLANTDLILGPGPVIWAAIVEHRKRAASGQTAYSTDASAEGLATAGTAVALAARAAVALFGPSSATPRAPVGPYIDAVLWLEKLLEKPDGRDTNHHDLRIRAMRRGFFSASARLIESLTKSATGEGREIPRTRISRDEANLRARDALKSKRRWSIRTLAKTIGCSTGLVGKLPAWLAWREEHKPRSATAPKRFSATPKVLESVGENDAELERLIADQQRDLEPSPLVTTGPRRGRRSKL